MEFHIDRDAACAVIGYGSWATALTKILTENGRRVAWYIPNPQVREGLLTSGNNPKYLSDVEFDTSRLMICDDLDRVVSSAGIILLAAPSAYLKTTLEPLSVSLADKFIISAIKGIVPDEYVTVTEYMHERYGLSYGQIGLITGPCHAEEVALERLSYLTVVCKDPENARLIGERFATRYIRIHTATDIYGIEYAAVLKNIYALAVGIASGLGYGDNFLAVLISNGALETARFLRETFPAERTTEASAYLGDLLVTSYSMFSRNRRFGVMIGRGYSVRDIRIEMNMVAEGYFAAECIRHVNTRHGVDMPIAQCVYDIVYGGASPAGAMKQLTEKLI